MPPCMSDDKQPASSSDQRWQVRGSGPRGCGCRNAERFFIQKREIRVRKGILPTTSKNKNLWRLKMHRCIYFSFLKKTRKKSRRVRFGPQRNAHSTLFMFVFHYEKSLQSEVCTRKIYKMLRRSLTEVKLKGRVLWTRTTVWTNATYNVSPIPREILSPKAKGLRKPSRWFPKW